MNLNDKVVLITGGSSGIGAASAIKFVEERAKVAIVGRNEKKLEAVSAKCQQQGNKPLVINADVTKDEDVKRIIDETIKHYGKIDVLVNNAGILTRTDILASNAMEVYDNTMSVDLRSVVYLTHLAAPYLIETKGNIVNVSSGASMVASLLVPFPYSVAKAGLDHFTRCVAHELASKEVRVNVVNPGPVKTDIMKNGFSFDEKQDKEHWDRVEKFNPLQRSSESEEIADLIVYLASDKARSVTGSAYVIDNGALLQ